MTPGLNFEEISAFGLLVDLQKRPPAPNLIEFDRVQIEPNAFSATGSLGSVLYLIALKRMICHLKVVWNGSMEIGVGSAISKTYGFISVARYSPKGGEGGPQAFRKNVFAKGKIRCC